MPFYPGSAADKQSRRAITGNSWGEVSGILPQLAGQDTFNPGDSKVASNALPPSIAETFRDRQGAVARLAQTASFPLELIGQDQRTAGQASQDLAPKPAARASDYSFTAAFPLTLVGQDAVTPGVESQDLPPKAAARPSTLHEFPTSAAALLLSVQLPSGQSSIDAQYRTVPRARDYSIAASFPLELIGKDAVNPGAQLSGNTPPVVARAPTLSEPGPNLTIALAGAAASIPVGLAALDSQYRPIPRSRDYSVTASFTLELIGQDTFTAGDQLSGNAPATALRASTLSEPGVNLAILLSAAPPVIPPGLSTLASDLAPRTAARARDYSLLGSFPLTLIGQDQMAAGDQSQELAPKTAQRTYAVYDPGTNAALTLAQPSGQSAQDAQYRLVPRARDYSVAAWYFLGLVGQDAFAPGDQLSGNAPAGAQRASTLSESGSNQTIALSALPPVIPCGQSTAASELYPRAAARARDYSFLAAFPLELIGKDAVNPGASTAATENPPKASPRARDYSLTVAFPLTLIGADQFPNGTGGQVQDDWTNPVRTIPRSLSVYDPGVNLTLGLPVATVAQPPGAQSFDLPTRQAARSRDYSFSASYFAGLIGKDALNAGAQLSGNAPAGPRRATEYTFVASFPLLLIGQDTLTPGGQSFDLPPRAPARLRDYGQTFAFPLELIGKDQLPVGDSTASSELTPKGPARARDYTWLQSLPLYVYAQLPPGQSTSDTELAPRAPARLPDYSFLSALKAQFIGKDTLFGQPGEVQAFDWQLPPRAAPRAVDYSWTQTFSRGSGIPPRDLQYIVSAPMPKWVTGELQEAKWRTFGLPPGKWKAGLPTQ